MPGDERKHAKMMSFTPILNGAPFMVTVKNWDKSAAGHPHLHHLYGEFENSCTFCLAEVKAEMLKKPTVWAHLLQEDAEIILLEPSAAMEARQRVREKAISFHPTAWDHLLRDDLG